MTEPIIILGVAGFMVTWTGSIVAVLLWLNRQFGSLKEAIDSRLSISSYQSRHDELSNRVRALELWAAKKNRPNLHGT